MNGNDYKNLIGNGSVKCNSVLDTTCLSTLKNNTCRDVKRRTSILQKRTVEEFNHPNQVFFIEINSFKSDSLAPYRSSHQSCSMKKGILTNFCEIHRKTPLPESLF